MYHTVSRHTGAIYRVVIATIGTAVLPAAVSAITTVLVGGHVLGAIFVLSSGLGEFTAFVVNVLY